jgi:hypothetical protein
MRNSVLLTLVVLAAACTGTPEQQAANDAGPANEAPPAEVARHANQARNANDELDFECPDGTKLVELRDRIYCVDPDVVQEEIERAWDLREDW